VEVDGSGLTLPEGDDVHYTIHCKGTSRQTGLDATVPSRNAHDLEELQKQIGYHPNGCISDEDYDRQLIIDALTRSATGEWEITETVTGDGAG